MGRLFWYGNGDSSNPYEYDSGNPTQYADNLISNMIMHPGVSVALPDGTYPVSIFESRGVSTATAAKWPSGYAPQGVVVADDPLKQFDEYYICNGEAVEWVVKNIFNVGDADCSVLRESGDSSSLTKYYYSDGKYYARTGGLGWGGIDVDIICKVKKTRLFAEYKSESPNGADYAIAAIKRQ